MKVKGNRDSANPSKEYRESSADVESLRAGHKPLAEQGLLVQWRD